MAELYKLLIILCLGCIADLHVAELRRVCVCLRIVFLLRALAGNHGWYNYSTIRIVLSLFLKIIPNDQVLSRCVFL